MPVIAETRRRLVRALVRFCAFALAIGAGCEEPPPTELLVRVDTDFPLAGSGEPDAIDAIVLRVLRIESEPGDEPTPIGVLDSPRVGTPVAIGDDGFYTFRFMHSYPMSPQADLLPIELGVVPEGWAASRRVLVQAFAMHGTEVAASAQARLGYVAERVLSVYLYVWRLCNNVECNTGETCYRATCIPDVVREECLPGGGGTPADGCDGGPPASLDVGLPDVDGRDLGGDRDVPDAGECTCPDGVECTVDTCEPGTRACSSVPDDARCREDQRCDAVLGCVRDACATDGDCDDGDACTRDSCSATLCRHDAMTCDDADPCTVDSCSPITGTCVVARAPDESPCGATGRCCDGTCAARDDPAHCATCGEVCGANETCSVTGCACAPGFQDCDAAPGCESSIATDPAHCGDCATRCSGAASSCVGGACRACVSAADCDDRLACTTDACVAGSCARVLGAGCLIDGACVASGARRPGNPCQGCEPSVDANGWSNLTGGCDDGDPCTAASMCEGGACGGGFTIACDVAPSCAIGGCDPDVGCRVVGVVAGQCLIGGRCYAAGAPNPLTPDIFPPPCQACVPAVSQTAWSAPPDGTACDDDVACTAGDTCVSGICRGGPSPCPASPAPGCTIACAEIATGYRCTSSPTGQWCFIDGECVHESWNDAHPTNQCLGCEPSISRTAWSPRTANDGVQGEPCTDHQFCTNGERCTLDPANPQCVGGDPSCDDGIACTIDACNEGANRCNTPTLEPGVCLIAGVCVAERETEPGNPCRECDPTRSTTSWVDVPQGLGCGETSACCDGACQPCTQASCGCEPCSPGELCEPTPGPELGCFCNLP